MRLEELISVISEEVSIRVDVPPDANEETKREYVDGGNSDIRKKWLKEYLNLEVVSVADGDRAIRIYLKGWDKNLKSN